MTGHKFKVGDTVIVKECWMDRKEHEGKKGLIQEDYGDGSFGLELEGAIGCVATKIEAVEKPAREFKVGDRVRIVSCGGWGLFVGKKAKVKGFTDIKTHPYELDLTLPEGMGNWFADFELELITPTPTRYTGELREGMIVVREDRANPLRVEVRDNEFYVFYIEQEPYSPRFKLEKTTDGWRLEEYKKEYIGRVISEPEEKECGDKWDPGEGDTTAFTYARYPTFGEASMFDAIQFELLQGSGFFIKNSPKPGLKTIMSNTLKKATNLIHSQAEPLKSYLRLGWVTIEDTEFEVTEAGAEAMTKYFFGFAVGSRSLGDYAQNEVKRLEKEEKKAKR